MIDYIKHWLSLTLPSKKEVDRIIFLYETNIDAQLTHEEYHLLWYIDMYLDTHNTSQHHILFNMLLRETKNYLSSISNHTQHKELKQIITVTGNRFDNNFLIYLITLEIFKGLAHHSSDYLYDHESSNDSSRVRMFSIIEFVEKVSTKVGELLGILWGAGAIQVEIDKRLAIKKAILTIIHNFVESNPNAGLSIKTKELSQVRTPKDFLNTKLKSDITSSVEDFADEVGSQENFIKISILVIDLEVLENPLYTYNVWPTPGSFITRDNKHWVTSPLLAVSNYLIIQKTNKEPTVIKGNFLKKITCFTKTAFYIDHTSCESTLELAQLELKFLEKNLEDIYAKISTRVSVESFGLPIENIRELIRKLTSVKKSQDYKRMAFEDKLLTSLNTSNTSRSEIVGDYFKNQLNISKDISIWYYLIRKNNDLQGLLPELQKIFSHLQILRKFFNYCKFLYKSNFDKIYFPIHLDFRGRLYYNSPVSVQAYWCYRFLYHFGPDTQENLTRAKYLFDQGKLDYYTELSNKYQLSNPNYLEVFQSIGFLFKKSLTNREGLIDLDAIVKFGVEIFLKHRFAKLPDLCEAYNNDYKLIIELHYYINIINRMESGEYLKFYIWKDTTCSMAQHAGKLLGYNLENLKDLNLQNDQYAVDTYQIFINKLRGALATLDNRRWDDTVLGLLNRSVLKNLIMTVEYGVTLSTARFELKSIIKPLCVKNNTYKRLLEDAYINDLYTTLKSGVLDQHFYLMKKSQWVELFMKSASTTFSLADIDIPVSYYQNIPTILYVEKNSQGGKRSRSTLSVPFPIPENLDLYQKLLNTKRFKNLKFLNKRKANTSLYVNAVHALDALYLREIGNECEVAGIPLAAVHDGFAVPITHGSWIISACNCCFFAGVSGTKLYYNVEEGQIPQISSNSIIV